MGWFSNIKDKVTNAFSRKKKKPTKVTIPQRSTPVSPTKVSVPTSKTVIEKKLKQSLPTKKSYPTIKSTTSSSTRRGSSSSRSGGGSGPSTYQTMTPSSPSVPHYERDGKFYTKDSRGGEMFVGKAGRVLPVTGEDIAMVAGGGLVKGGVKTTASISTNFASSKLLSGGLKTLKNLGKSTGRNTLITTTNVATGKITRKMINTQVIEKTSNILKTKFSQKALVIAGAWAGAVGLGLWGQAESTEPIGITMTKYLIPNARETGNWSLVEEAQEARNEILDLQWWETAMLWSPVSPFIGVTNKIKGGIFASKAQDAVIKDMKIQQETGESDDDKWRRVNQEKADQEKANIDYYNSERKKQLLWEKEAKDRGMREDAKFWADQRRKQREEEAKDRKAIADFWEEYKKEQQKMQDDSRPSNLGFGLI